MIEKKLQTAAMKELLENLRDEVENQVGKSERIIADWDDNTVSAVIQRKIGKTTQNILVEFGDNENEN
jgi:hypothetical protein